MLDMIAQADTFFRGVDPVTKLVFGMVMLPLGVMLIHVMLVDMTTPGAADAPIFGVRKSVRGGK